MNIQKYLERLEYMDELIRRKATGTPDEFAMKLEISRSALDKYIKVLKDMGAPIKYDEINTRYYYLFPCRLTIGFESSQIDEKDLTIIHKNNLKKICEILIT